MVKFYLTEFYIFKKIVYLRSISVFNNQLRLVIISFYTLKTDISTTRMLKNKNITLFRQDFLLILIFNLLFCWGWSQNSNSSQDYFNQSQNPSINHFTRTDFNADSQFWSVVEDNDGLMYFGNNDGVLIYDGSHWKHTSLPNSSSVRSLAKDSSGIIYAGGYHELGIVRKDKFGNFKFKSLKEKLQLENVDFENIWQINVIQNKVIFRSFKKLFIVENNSVTQIPSKNTFIESFVVNNRFFVQDADEGIFEVDLQTNQIQKLIDKKSYDNEKIVHITDHFDLISGSGTIYSLQDSSYKIAQQLFMKNNDQVISSIECNEIIYLGTLSSGVVVLKKNKDHYTVHPINNLQGSTVLNLYNTRKNNIWVLLDNGLDKINYSSPRTTIFSRASVYDTFIGDSNLYIATNQGVYFSENASTPNHFNKIESLQGQAWSIAHFNNTLLVSHDKGLFKINEDFTSTRIGNTNGVWKVIPFPNHLHTFLVCTYNGIYILKNENGSWNIQNKVEGFDESARDILKANQENSFWVCHGYKGVYKITISRDLKRTIAIDHYTDKNGLPSPFNVNVFKWNNHTVFTTNNGVYEFNEISKQFSPFEPLNKIVDTSKNTRKIVQDSDRTWVIQDDEAGYFETKSNNPKIVKDIFLQTKGTFNRGMETIVPVNKEKVLIGTHTGLYLYNLNQQNSKEKIQTQFTAISYTIDDERRNLPIQNDSTLELPNNLTSIKFSFAAPKMPNNLSNGFSYKLENADKNWSPWQSLPFKEFNLLRPGSYTFKVKSKNVLGIEAEVARYDFYIQPKWYQTNLAYFSYAIIFFILVFITQKLVRNKIHKENEKTILREQRTNQLLQLEIEQLKLQKDKEKVEKDKEHLEKDIIQKSKELANYTMLLVNKKNFFNALQDDLKELKNIVKNRNSKQKILEIFQKLHQNKIDEEYFKVFDENFEKVHQNFFNNLKENAPTLSKKEIRLSAFIKMGLTNKEIAPLLNISTRGVETARYRLRKKLNLDQDDKLMEFFDSLA